MKTFNPEFGVQLDSCFAIHAEQCERCGGANPRESPADLGNLCLEGSILYKRENAISPKREPKIKPEHWASKKELAQVMKYK